MRQVKKPGNTIVTPLRYPGGKSSLASFFSGLLSEAGLKNVTYIEPYAGGAGAALALLSQGIVKSIVINDYDPALYAFWLSVTQSPEQFIKRIRGAELTIDEWLRQREVYRTADLANIGDLGFAAFYMNRCNRSGILKAGVIGGKAQSGTYKLDARFNKETLIKRIEHIATLADRIEVSNKDGISLIREKLSREDSFFYIDPPYYVKGSGLYLNAFVDDNHRELALILNENPQAKWVLSYDNVEFISSLYKDRETEVFDLSYSVHADSKKGSELMVFSDSVITNP